MGSLPRLLAVVGPLLLLFLFAIADAARLPFIRALSRQTDVPRVPPSFNLNSGGPDVGRFVEDLPWVVGETGASDIPDASIGGADEINLPTYNSHRFGVDGSTWGYDIPVRRPGVYGCTVHFAETDFASFVAGARVFDILFSTASGDPVRFNKIDVFGELGDAEFTVLTKTAGRLVIPGILSVRAIPRKGDAIISGLTCERTGDLPDGVAQDFDTKPPIPPNAVVTTPIDPTAEADPVMQEGVIDVNAGGKAIGRFQEEDANWIFGSTSLWGGPPGVVIGGAEERNTPALISQRYGLDGAVWGYRIPVEKPGIYACSVHFAETDSASFAVGARIFNVQIMDEVMTGIDVYAEAGPARFTSVVRTFTDLKVGDELFLKFTPVKRDAFLSALTCEKTAELDPNDPSVSNIFGSESPEASPMNPDASPALEETSPFASPGVESSVIASPMAESPSEDTPSSPTAGGLETVDPSPTPTVPASNIVTVTPAPDPTPEDPESSLEPSPIDTLTGPVEDTANTATPDSELTAGDGQRSEEYRLLGSVTDTSSFTPEMKDALITESRDITQSPSEWAMIHLQEETIEAVTRQEKIPQPVTRQEARVYQIDLQALYSSPDYDSEVQRFKEFVSDGRLTSALQNRGISNLEVRFEETPGPNPTGDSPEASTTSTSKVVGIVVGCVLGLLLVVAVSAFVVVRRSRGIDASQNGFDAPPPAMTESEISSVMERSETAASVEYLDDDSTFTAATSRAGDHIDQVAFDKDVFGRGTATGSHGVS